MRPLIAASRASFIFNDLNYNGLFLSLSVLRQVTGDLWMWQLYRSAEEMEAVEMAEVIYWDWSRRRI